jgi:protein SCO1/2
MSKGIMSPPANVRPPYLENVGIEQRLDAQVPPDLAFTDDAGRPVKLGDYFGKKPPDPQPRVLQMPHALW